MATITNPILPGFNPDPSILRVGEDYYVATSTFEWFPGVQIHHSRDLVNWRLLTHPLDRLSQLDLRGDPSSGGIWAPCLTHSDGLFWLIYTDQKNIDGAFWDPQNYLVTAEEITGPWSEPVFLNSSGFDPSLFHDDDGRRWLLNMLMDFRMHRTKFSGIILQEYSHDEKRLVGPVSNVFAGTDLGVTEGPHVYKRNGTYYLMTAEGGTGYRHSVTMARSQDLRGPYEVDPANPVLTASDKPEAGLQKAGHASVVETQTGEWYMVHLCGRPVMPARRCTLGRETAIQRMHWTEDGWLRIEGGGNGPRLEVPGPDIPVQPFEPEAARDDFDSAELGVHFQTLRVPADESWLSLTERPGYLRLRGRQSLYSRYSQSLVARRWQHFRFEAATCVEFEPDTFQQMAGLIAFYDTQNWFYLRVSRDEALGKFLCIASSDNGRYDELNVDYGVSIEGRERVCLKAVVDVTELRFSYSLDGEEWRRIGEVYDATQLSDEYCREGRFTGAFVGLSCQDVAGLRKHADFDWFEYRPLD